MVEFRKLLDACEGALPGTGGYAQSTHGHLRSDVTDRGGIPNDSAFTDALAMPFRGGGTGKSKVVPMDMAMAVTNPFNSPKDQEKLKQLWRKAATGSGPVGNAIHTEVTMGRWQPKLRIEFGTTESSGYKKQIKIELFKIEGKLHIHPVYILGADASPAERTADSSGTA